MEGNLVSVFQEEYGRVLQMLQSFSFCPENLPPASAQRRKPSDKKTLDKQTSKKSLQGPVSRVLDPLAQFNMSTSICLYSSVDFGGTLKFQSSAMS